MGEMNLYRKLMPETFLNRLRRSPLRWVLSGVLLYIAVFVIVSQIYTLKMAQFSNKIMRVYSQLSAQNKKMAMPFSPDLETLLTPEKLDIFNPSTVFFSLLSFEKIRSEGETKLQRFIMAFKEDLSKIDLSEVDLSGKALDFSGANFSHANLTRVNFSNANLSSANLSGADLTEADLSGVNLIDAVLVGADLSRANLSGAILPNADLTRAVLREAIIIEADLTGVNLFFADLSGAILRESSLVGADLSGVTLYHADLIAVNFSRARLSGADLNGADLRYANLTTTTGLKQHQLDHGIVDGKTQLPEGFRRRKTVK